MLRKARERGIKVLTWDADAEADARDFFVNQATPEGIATTLTDEAARLLGGRGEFAIVTGALSAANQNEWIANIKKRLAEKYPDLTLATIRPSDDDRDKAFAETQTILRVYPDGQAGDGDFGAGRARRGRSGASGGRARDVNVIGLSLPNINKPYVHGGVVQAVILWNTRDLGYLTVLAAAKLLHRRPARRCRRRSMPGGSARIEVRGSRDHPRRAAADEQGKHRSIRFLEGTGEREGWGIVRFVTPTFLLNRWIARTFLSGVIARGRSRALMGRP